MIGTTSAQLREMRLAREAKNWSRNEKVWTFLVASILARSEKQPELMALFCGEPVSVPEPLDVWFEAQPMPPRKGREGDSEGNSRIDLAFGNIAQRAGTGSGIGNGPIESGSWVCFVEAKCLSDCSSTVTYDPLRNQLARVIENLLCFQGKDGFPEKLYYFTLLTPRLFKENRDSRLYGYKMREYQNRARLLDDIERYRIDKRGGPRYRYPELADRARVLKLNWITYEEILETVFGPNLDIVYKPRECEALVEHLRTLAELAEAAAESSVSIDESVSALSHPFRARAGPSPAGPFTSPPATTSPEIRCSGHVSARPPEDPPPALIASYIGHPGSQGRGLGGPFRRRRRGHRHGEMGGKGVARRQPG